MLATVLRIDFACCRFPRGSLVGQGIRRTHLARYFGIGETLPENMRQHHLKSFAVANRVLFAAAIVVAERLFVEIPEQMERLDTYVGSLQSAFQEAPEVFESIGVDVAANVPLGVVYHFMLELIRHFEIRHEVVRVDGAAGFDVLLNLTVQCLAVAIRNDSGADFSIAFEQSDNGNLPANASRVQFPTPRCPNVHEASLSADEGFVHFHFAAGTAEFHKRAPLHGEPDAVKHEPCRLLSDADGACNLVGTDAVLAVGDHPHSYEPFVERDRRVLKDRSDLHRKLPMMMDALALPFPLIREEARIGAPASRALDAVPPAESDHPVEAVVGVGEVDDGLLQRVGLFHGLSSDSYSTSEALIRQLYYCLHKNVNRKGLRQSSH